MSIAPLKRSTTASLSRGMTFAAAETESTSRKPPIAPAEPSTRRFLTMLVDSRTHLTVLPNMSKRTYPRRSDLEILGEASVYPGHPITVGLIIMETYDSYSDANHTPERSEQDKKWGYSSCPDALSNGDIPGAGGCVYAALDFLKLALETGVDEAIQQADKVWGVIDDQKKMNPARYQEGQDQADKIKDRVRTKLATWGK